MMIFLKVESGIALMTKIKVIFVGGHEVEQEL